MYGGGEQTVSEGWRKPLDLVTTVNPNVSSTMVDDEHFCKLVLYKEIQDSRVRIWDLAILVPNLLLLLFIAVRFNRARLKLRATSSPIFLAFYGLVICNVVISVIRCVVSMTVDAATNIGGKADKVLWVTVRFFLLSTEMSVVIFGLAFGHLDSRSSIRRVLFATSLIALTFTITQGTLELVLPDDTFHIPSRDFYVFGHGGMMFWFCSSLVFTLIYFFILILPWTRLRDRLNLPTRKSFYVYVGILTTLNLVQSVGAGLLNYTQNLVGLCVVDITAVVYLTLFTPLVYHTFLSEFFGVSQPSILFSYKAQVDDAMEEDTVSLPYQQSFSSLKTDSDYIYQVHTPYNHLPLYEPFTAKLSSLKQRTSLYSSAKNNQKPLGKSSYSSQNALDNVPEMQNSRKECSVHSSTPNFSSCMESSPKVFVGTNTLYLDFDNQTTLTPSNIVCCASSSESNLILSPDTAANVDHKLDNTDSDINTSTKCCKSDETDNQSLNV
ncbi:transmembrane protein adipocyte-associated 1 homolog isoform X1 [Microplitis demolitor]|uniref:transmembrane protein adipocyte-associated 1 homolog isoform X1 n=1 Tax=Microplitis demolitor TaxID=69319 RepID=UPI0004CD1FB0|nr:transmembrane protein adipocyte-associated 1 homolog isoform X1 [Microplitis demolitor]XP_053594242.1 transmembrane protein adipocyte-associated 1 homolog isoform X1 [Microplitis demolitor]